MWLSPIHIYCTHQSTRTDSSVLALVAIIGLCLGLLDPLIIMLYLCPATHSTFIGREEYMHPGSVVSTQTTVTRFQNIFKPTYSLKQFVYSANLVDKPGSGGARA